MAESVGAPETSAKPPPPRIGRLDTLVRVRREATKLYAAARAGEVPAADASRLGSLLALIATLLRDDRLGALEDRVLALEAAGPRP